MKEYYDLSTKLKEVLSLEDQILRRLELIQRKIEDYKQSLDLLQKELREFDYKLTEVQQEVKKLKKEKF
ncbi:hypothetical protein [Hydrogenobacter hydrogenophilus]|uniref:Uncharacterized protein n=1 Tax=Hydrogenobacter hydrogenophilus TaxID=35835 RepID=A0A285P1Q8_9AQUI|nr:hypothetical protein [Hydrogenobacter hydrogenophilus]SNZ15217.1 hypothetical protein SAMN06265353_1325 [Hydrogenobacter hydrogenophilus]